MPTCKFVYISPSGSNARRNIQGSFRATCDHSLTGRLVRKGIKKFTRSKYLEKTSSAPAIFNLPWPSINRNEHECDISIAIYHVNLDEVSWSLTSLVVMHRSGMRFFKIY